eukprot:m.42262 g.42262  ORF g.42262 m.42262 type:complete len:1372 (-) comp5713_c0_seq1:634-4749(-)
MSAPDSPQISGSRRRVLPSAPGGPKTPLRKLSEAEGTGRQLPESPRLLPTISHEDVDSEQTAPPGEAQNVIVAVRVRPFNERELRLGCIPVIQMRDNKTYIHNEEKGKSHDFAYDASFSSQNPSDPTYATQEHIYNTIGKPLVDRTLEGYNCCMFAYGQTGSGKSYSMMGYANDPGLIPRFCRDLFERMSTNDGTTTFKTEVSYFEIYSENIYDLLSTKGSKRKLRVREHPVLGPYVEDLTTFAAVGYDDVQGYLDIGSKQRATAATNMNATSSRSHSVFSIILTQTVGSEGEELTKVSRVNLVDLAGSERSDAAGTSGLRLKEGSAINKSLHTLGKVISILATRHESKKRVFIPYRDSVLTWILKDSLGGNSRTAMLATISPASDNYDETLSTLRYASQARSIVNMARVNEDPNVALIRSLRAEIDALRSQFGDSRSLAALAEVENLRSKLTASERLVQEVNREWEEKLRTVERRREENQRRMEQQGVTEDLRKVENRVPNLVNLNEDPQLSETLIYIIKEGETFVGSEATCEVRLQGAFVRPRHCVIESREGAVTIRVLNDAAVYVNGSQVDEAPRALTHGDRIIFGNHHYFRLNIPQEKAAGETKDFSVQGVSRDYTFAHEEFKRIQTERMQAELAQEKQAIAERAQAELTAQRLALERVQEEQRRALEAAEEAKRLQLELEFSERMEELETLFKKREEGAGEAAREEERQKLKTEHEAQLQAQREQSQREREEAMRALDEARQARLEAAERERQELLEKLQRAEAEREAALKAKASNDADSQKAEMSMIELVREANELVQSRGLTYKFRRGIDENGSSNVQVLNTHLKIKSTWAWPKFTDRLDELRTLFADQEGTPEEMAEEMKKVVYNPNDEWINEEDRDAKTARAAALALSPAHPSSARVSTTGKHTSVALLARKYIENGVESLRSTSIRRSDVIVTYLSSIKTSVDSLVRSFDTHDTAEGPLVECSDVRNACMSATVLMNLLYSAVRNLRSNSDTSNSFDLLDNLANAASGLSDQLLRLLQALENGSKPMLTEAHDDIQAAIAKASMVVGELTIATYKAPEGEVVDASDDVDDDDMTMDDPFSMSGHMVDLRALRDSDSEGSSPQTLDRAVLEAFSRGAKQQVANALDACKRSLADQVEQLRQMAAKLSDRSNINVPVLAAVERVVGSASLTIERAQEFQTLLAEREEDAVERAFYRKNYAKAKGVVAQVQAFTTAVSQLTDSCSFAVAGSEDIEEVMSHVIVLRRDLAQLQAAASTKASTQALRNVAQKIAEAGNVVAKDCVTVKTEGDAYRSSDSVMSRRASVRSTSGLITPIKATPSGSLNSPVLRQARIIEQNAVVLRLENELKQAQRSLQALNKEQYNP